MKKLILIAATIVFIGNITGQRQKEELVPLSSSKSYNLFESGSTTTTQSIRCYLTVVSKNSPKVNYMMEHMYMNTYSSIDAMLGGIPVKYLDVDNSEKIVDGNLGTVSSCRTNTTVIVDKVEVRKVNGNQKNDINKINKDVAITPEEIKKIPYVIGEDDITQVLLLMGCPRETSTEEITENSVTSEADQGPVTGLEGHNFIEHPAIIYPNPVKDVLQVKSTDPITVIEILGITGQLEMILDNRSTMDVSTLAAGTYYARIHFENIKEVQVEKIIIIK